MRANAQKLWLGARLLRAFIVIAAWDVAGHASGFAASGFATEADALAWYAEYSHDVFELEDVDRAIRDYWDPAFTNAYAPEFPGGAAGMRAQVEPFLAAFDEIKVTIDALALSGENLIVRVRIGGQHVAPFMGFAATGRRVEFRETAWYQVQDRKFRCIWPAVDVVQLRAQLESAASQPAIGVPDWSATLPGVWVLDSIGPSGEAVHDPRWNCLMTFESDATFSIASRTVAEKHVDGPSGPSTQSVQQEVRLVGMYHVDDDQLVVTLAQPATADEREFVAINLGALGANNTFRVKVAWEGQLVLVNESRGRQLRFVRHQRPEGSHAQ